MPTAISIQQAVAEKIKTSGPQVEDMVVDLLAHQEITKRKDAIITALAKLKTLQAEQKKLAKADVKTHIPDGKGGFATYEAFSDEGKKKLEEGQKKVDQLEKAINNALESHDGETYGKLYEQVK